MFYKAHSAWNIDVEESKRQDSAGSVYTIQEREEGVTGEEVGHGQILDLYFPPSLPSFFLVFIYLFIHSERKRERQWGREREGERRRENTSRGRAERGRDRGNPKQAPHHHAETDAGLKLTNEIMT